MLFCKDFCEILVQNIGGNIEKWNLSARFLNVYGTRIMEFSKEKILINNNLFKI